MLKNVFILNNSSIFPKMHPIGIIKALPLYILTIKLPRYTVLFQSFFTMGTDRYLNESIGIIPSFNIV